jgi:hypothetical protein
MHEINHAECLKITLGCMCFAAKQINAALRMSKSMCSKGRFDPQFAPA